MRGLFHQNQNRDSFATTTPRFSCSSWLPRLNFNQIALKDKHVCLECMFMFPLLLVRHILLNSIVEHLFITNFAVALLGYGSPNQAHQNITPQTKQPWTARVHILQKRKPRLSASGAKQFQRLILSDSSGEVQATIFGADIDLFEHTLKLGQCYLLSNATVKFINLQHRVIDFDYQWTLNGKVVLEDAEYDPTLVAHQYEFIPLSEIAIYKNSANYIDVLAFAMIVCPQKHVQSNQNSTEVLELVLLDTTFQPVIFTLWNQFVENEGAEITRLIKDKPIVALKRVKVVSFNDVSLATRSATCITIGPDLPQVAPLLEWLGTHAAEVDEMIQSGQLLQLARQGCINLNDNINDIASILAIDKDASYILNCKLAVTDFTQDFWYMTCANCHKSTSARYNQSFQCLHCRRDVVATPRAKAHVEATDDSGTISATMFGVDAEQLLSSTALEIMQKSYMENAVPASTIVNSATDGNVKVKFKTWKQQYGENIVPRKVISYFHQIDQLAEPVLSPHATQATTSNSQEEALQQPLNSIKGYSKSHSPLTHQKIQGQIVASCAMIHTSCDSKNI